MNPQRLLCRPSQTGLIVVRVLASLLLLMLAMHWTLTWLMVFDEKQWTALLRCLFGIDEVYLDLDWDWVRSCWNAEGVLIGLQVLVAYRNCTRRRYWYIAAFETVVGALASVGVLELVYRLRVGDWSPEWLSVWSVMLLASTAGFLLGLPRWCRGMSHSSSAAGQHGPV